MVTKTLAIHPEISEYTLYVETYVTVVSSLFISLETILKTKNLMYTMSTFYVAADCI